MRWLLVAGALWLALSFAFVVGLTVGRGLAANGGARDATGGRER